MQNRLRVLLARVVGGVKKLYDRDRWCDRISGRRCGAEAGTGGSGWRCPALPSLAASGHPVVAHARTGFQKTGGLESEDDEDPEDQH
jgi:hypothetical protein